MGSKTKNKFFFFFFEEMISGKRKSFFTKPLLILLQGISWLWKFFSFWKNFFYDRGFFPAHRHHKEVFTISVGNLVAGGTGKTPFVELLAKQFESEFCAIFSRGYRSLSEKKGKIFSPGAQKSYEEMGDEPFLLSQKLPKSYFAIGKNRKQTAKKVLEMEKDKKKLFLLDDGFQYRGLFRDLDLVLLQAQDLFGQNFFLPRGFLREHPRGLKRANYLLINGASAPQEREELKTILKKVSPQAKMIFIEPVFSEIFPLSQIKNDFGEEKNVGAFCGIANPFRFQKLLEKENFCVKEFFSIGDHGSFSLESLKKFSNKAKEKGCKALVCTEKDRVKLKGLEDLSLPVFCVGMKLQIQEGFEEWQQLLGQVSSFFKGK